jgi:16S rRNA (cytidine1402-2'-O)-methyltransferase
MDAASGRLYCVATPIGNLQDMTLRAVEVLRSVDAVACEDTRSAGRLFSHLDISRPRFISMFEHNEPGRVKQLLEMLKSGKDIAIISEAGTPTISDPGYRLVAACVEADIEVIPVPGACAAVAALSASGLPTDRFLFLGFPPRKGAKLRRYLEQALFPARTSVCYLPARRWPGFLERVNEEAPGTRVVVARELTKVYEEFIRGTARELFESADQLTLKGECTVLLYVPDE